MARPQDRDSFGNHRSFRPASRHIFLLLCLVTVLVLMLTVASDIVSAAFSNDAVVLLRDVAACRKPHALQPLLNAPALRCVHDENRAGRARDLTAAAVARQPDSRNAQLHLAEALYQLDRVGEARALITPATIYPAGRSALLRIWEPYLFAGAEMVKAGRWSDAVRDLRLGLQWERPDTIATTPLEDGALDAALAEFYVERADGSLMSPQDLYLAGKYLGRVGQWAKAEEYLTRAVAEGATSKSAAWDEAAALTYLARAYLAQENPARAIATLEMAVARAPLPEAYARLLAIYRQTGDSVKAAVVEKALVELGPTYILGQQAPGFLAATPATLPNGWTLAGYDLDDETLASGREVELLLWWKAGNAAATPGETWLRVGDYWLEWRVATNLFPNAGFEWGNRADGLPLGHSHEFYGAPPGSLRVEEMNRADSQTHVLVADNSASSDVALTSYWFQPNPKSYYLMAGWLWDEGDGANIGRNCGWADGGGPYYIAYGNHSPLRPQETWVHAADLAPLVPGELPNRCQVLLVNNRSLDRAMWDDILWVELYTEPD